MYNLNSKNDTTQKRSKVYQSHCDQYSFLRQDNIENNLGEISKSQQSTIIIHLQTGQNENLQLKMSASNYKNDFKQFVKRNRISKKEAFDLKRIIIQKVKEIASNRKQIQNQQEKSPRFSLVQQDLKESSILSSVKPKLELNSQKSNNIIRGTSDEVESGSFIEYIKLSKHPQQLKINKYIQKVSAAFQQTNQYKKASQLNLQFDQYSYQYPHPNLRSKQIMIIKEKGQVNYNNKVKKNAEQNNIKSQTPKKYLLLENYTSRNAIAINNQDNMEKGINIKRLNQSPKQNKTTTKQQSLSQSHCYLDQKQLNHKVFFKLNRELTAAFRQKSSEDIDRKSLRDYEQIIKHQQQYRKKSKSSSINKQIFEKLYLTSTQSSFYRNKKQSQQRREQSKMQIKKVINQKSKSSKKPDLNSRVYVPNPKKNCNVHCEQFQFENKLKQQKQRQKQKQNSLRKYIKQRSLSQKLIKTRTKQSGECSCCHKQRLQKSKNQLKRNKAQGPRLKLNFISDVLEQSYQQLFSYNPTK